MTADINTFMKPVTTIILVIMIAFIIFKISMFFYKEYKKVYVENKEDIDKGVNKIKTIVKSNIEKVENKIKKHNEAKNGKQLLETKQN